MKMNLEWLKKHKVAAGAAILIGLLVVFFLFRNSGSSSSANGVASLAANQQNAQLQMAQLGAEESSQNEQLQAQLASQEYTTQASEQENQDQLAASIAGSILPTQIEAQFEEPLYSQELSLYGQELTGQQTEESALLPLEESAVGLTSNPNLAATGETTLAELLGEGASSSNKYGSVTFLPLGSTSTTPSTGLLGSLQTGLFG